MMKLEYNLGLVLEKDGTRTELDSNETDKVIDFLIDGICPFCLVEIPLDDRVCCDCLESIHAYHRSHHACHQS